MALVCWTRKATADCTRGDRLAMATALALPAPCMVWGGAVTWVPSRHTSPTVLRLSRRIIGLLPQHTAVLQSDGSVGVPAGTSLDPLPRRHEPPPRPCDTPSTL